MVEIKLPQTSQEIIESVVVFWHKSEGDWVEAGDVVVEIQTEKAVFEVDAPVAGRIESIRVKRGEVAIVGDVLATISSTDTGTLQQEPQAEAKSEVFVPASPRIRKLARDLGVDLALIKGTGPGGKHTEEDVRLAAQSSTPPIQRQDMIRRTIAKRMVDSIQQSAQLTITAWADVTELLQLRSREYPDVGLNAWIIKSLALALREHPDANAVWSESSVRKNTSVHIGVAVDTDQGLLVPVIRDADTRNVTDIQEQIQIVAEKTRQGILSHEEQVGGGCTVSNLGPYGVEFFTPILNPPESTILGVGATAPYWVMEQNQLIQRERLPLSLTFDHRVIDGAPAARFLQTIIAGLREPARLL